MIYPFFILNEFKKKIINVDFNINLYLNALILFTFLTIFFINFISKVSTNVFTDEVSKLTNDIVINNVESLKKNNDFKTITDLLPLETMYNYYYNQNLTVNILNDNLVDILIIANILAWILFIVIIIILKYYSNIEMNLEEIVIEKIFIFIIVGIFYYYFFTHIGTNFIPIQPSFISKKFIQNCLKLLEKN